MFFAFEILDIAASGPLLIRIPESAGLLAFGVGLVSAAVILRWVLGKGETAKRDRNKSE